ncbi:PHB depolymerase family esterase [Variovorax sp. J22P271]|uniref:extracellular catalytic domain type 1 short-chain-length polyhydroxyalkanoate depolymerase n=1 Tax=Variovorax davisae TaxID=3053515 RepID=UPI0025765BC7|nr:PHB depolymerase family esterase [Variovorax sp. J22P271]MDM0035896.1 PHB depolymerase family esterase [Variovorax sp. J22P271]
MARRSKSGGWLGVVARGMEAITRGTLRAGTRAVDRTVKPVLEKRRAPAGAGQWIPGLAMGATGMRRFRLYRPPEVGFGERLPLMVMLHGCGQDAKTFATSTRMNLIAGRERFMVLYPEQDRVSNPQGCWNWFDTSSGRAYGEVALIMKTIDQVCLMYAVDRTRIAVAGLSAGASMAALLVARHPDRFGAVVMHSGIPPGTAHSTLSALGAMHGHRSTKPLAASPLAPVAGWPPLMVIHGARDSVVAASNGLAAVRAWADAMGATSSKKRTVRRGQRYPATVTDFKRRGSTVATLVEVDRLGHAWSGGAASQPYSDGAGPDASRMAWSFAARQFAVRHAAARHYISARPH